MIFPSSRERSKNSYSSVFLVIGKAKPLFESGQHEKDRQSQGCCPVHCVHSFVATTFDLSQAAASAAGVSSAAAAAASGVSSSVFVGSVKRDQRVVLSHADADAPNDIGCPRFAALSVSTSTYLSQHVPPNASTSHVLPSSSLRPTLPAHVWIPASALFPTATRRCH